MHLDWTTISVLLKELMPDKFIEKADGHLYVQPAGLLHLFPFSLVNALDTKPSLALTIYFPVDFMQPSLTYGDNRDVVIFSAPELAIDDSNDWRSGLPELSWSRLEVENIETGLQAYQHIHYTGTDASRASFFSAQTRQAKVLHIATHSFYSRDQPHNIGFTLSDVTGINEPGFVSFTEVNQFKFYNDLVVVSGCESGLGLFNSYRGNFSMATAFLMAGAKQSIGTLWPISDKATAEFAKHFYSALSDKQTISQALAIATEKLSSNPRFKHPYYWAGFTLYSRILQQKTIN